jgi:hypothetical protein
MIPVTGGHYSEISETAVNNNNNALTASAAPPPVLPSNLTPAAIVTTSSQTITAQPPASSTYLGGHVDYVYGLLGGGKFVKKNGSGIDVTGVAWEPLAYRFSSGIAFGLSALTTASTRAVGDVKYRAGYGSIGWASSPPTDGSSGSLFGIRAVGGVSEVSYNEEIIAYRYGGHDWEDHSDYSDPYLLKRRSKAKMPLYGLQLDYSYYFSGGAGFHFGASSIYQEHHVYTMLDQFEEREQIKLVNAKLISAGLAYRF